MGVQLGGFDASLQGDMQSFDPLPPGDYLMLASSAEQRATKANDGQYLMFTMEVLDGPHRGRKHFVRLNLWNANQTAVDIANRELGAICKAVGIIRPNSTDDLVNKPMIVELGVKKNKEGKEEQVVRGYKPASPGAALAAPGAAPAPAPASVTNASGTVPAPASAAPPWAKKAA